MQLFVRVLGAATFSLVIAAGSVAPASAAINVGATLAEYDNKLLLPILYLSAVRTLLRNLPVRY